MKVNDIGPTSRRVACAALTVWAAGGCDAPSDAEGARTASVLRVAVTTSTRDSGILDALLPTFEADHRARVDVIAVGTGKALKLGANGDVDVVLVHSRQDEEAFLRAGHGDRREDVMYNTFELLGPAVDPAGIRNHDVVSALQALAHSGHRFVSRGDDSGTHKRERMLWARGGGRPEWPDYVESGQGMGATLVMADQMNAYTLSDRGTFLQFRKKIDLVSLGESSTDLQNPYGALTVNAERHPGVKRELAERFVDYLIAPCTQRRIADFRIDGEPLFYPLRLPDARRP